MLFSYQTYRRSASAVFTITLPVWVHAQSHPPTTHIEPIIQTQPIAELKQITVHGHQLSTSDLLNGSSFVNHQQILERNITNWEDFSKRGELGINYNRQNKSINVRGVDADRVSTRIDGVPLPWLTDGARGVQGGLNAVSFDTLSSISVAGNADTVRSGAITGSLNLSTLSPHQLLSGDKNVGALIKSTYDSADYSRSIHAAVAGKFSDQSRWLLQAGLKQGDQLRNYDGVGGYGPNRTQVNPLSFKENNFMLKLEQDLTPNHQLELSGERFHYSADIDNLRDQGPGTNFVLNGNTSHESTQRERLILGYNYQADTPKATLATGQIKAWWQQVQLQSHQMAERTPDARGFIIPGDPFQYQFPYGNYERDNRAKETSYGVTSAWSGYIDQTSTLHNWSAGGDWYLSRTTQDSQGYDNCPSIRPGLPAPFGPRACDLLHTGQADMPKVEGNTLALWLQDTMSWSNGRYALTPGLRFDSYHYKPKKNSNYLENPNAGLSELASNRAHRFSPSLRASFNPSDTVSMYISYAHGFKAPSPSQLYLTYGAPGTYLTVGNPNLRPETSRGLELGIEAGDSALGGSLRFFHNNYRNFIDTNYGVTPNDPNWNSAWTGQYPMGVTMAVNKARARIYGIEASGQWQIDTNWYTQAAVTWARGKDTATNRPLNTVAPLKSRLVAGYERTDWGAEAQLNLVAKRSQVANTTDFQAPGYSTTDLAFWWQPPIVKGLRVQAGVYNLFDKKYWEALSVPNGGRSLAPVDYYSEPGRTFRLALTYSY